MKIKTCCFIGHRTIETTLELRKLLYNHIENLIVSENVKVFLFGSRSQFNDLCYYIVSKLKEKYTDIKRVYVRMSGIPARYPLRYGLRPIHDRRMGVVCAGSHGHLLQYVPSQLL